MEIEKVNALMDCLNELEAQKVASDLEPKQLAVDKMALEIAQQEGFDGLMKLEKQYQETRKALLLGMNEEEKKLFHEMESLAQIKIEVRQYIQQLGMKR